MTEPYTPPKISNELGRPMAEAAADRNRFARGVHSHALTEIDGHAISDIAAKFGSPTFVFSEKKIREKARAMRDAFRSRYPHCQFGWSYKTNYLKAICKIFHQCYSRTCLHLVLVLVIFALAYCFLHTHVFLNSCFASTTLCPLYLDY